MKLISFDEWMGAQPREGAYKLAGNAWQARQTEIDALKTALSQAIKEADDWAFHADGVRQVESLDTYRELIK